MLVQYLSIAPILSCFLFLLILLLIMTLDVSTPSIVTGADYLHRLRKWVGSGGSIFISSLQEIKRYKPLQQSLNCCMSVFQEMCEVLEASIRDWSDSQNSARDWLSMCYREKGFKDIKQLLVVYESALSSAFNSIKIWTGNNVFSSELITLYY